MYVRMSKESFCVLTHIDLLVYLNPTLLNMNWNATISMYKDYYPTILQLKITK